MFFFLRAPGVSCLVVCVFVRDLIVIAGAGAAGFLQADPDVRTDMESALNRECDSRVLFLLGHAQHAFPTERVVHKHHIICSVDAPPYSLQVYKLYFSRLLTKFGSGILYVS